ncbi:hypothetical protein ULG90_05385 [Halopseudomonas pachastrellae]|nr:hypothetical protein ULG90_05385 [Halopseudomonas pachastrellae]
MRDKLKDVLPAARACNADQQTTKKPANRRVFCWFWQTIQRLQRDDPYNAQRTSRKE